MDAKNNLIRNKSPEIRVDDLSKNNTGKDSNNSEKVNQELNKENKYMDYFFISLTMVGIIGSFIMIFSYDSYWSNIIMYKPEGYQIPKISDLKFCLVCIPFFVLVKCFFEYGPPLKFMYITLAQKYKDPSNDLFKLGKIYNKKQATSLYKVIFYSLSVIIGHYICKDIEFFDWRLGGNGDYNKLNAGGYPHYKFWEKPEFFDYYYLTGLSFVCTDLIWLLFIYEWSSDFYLMICHHTITITLVIFSFLTNNSAVGIMVFYLHDITDVFVYAARIGLNTDFNEIIRVTPCVGLLLSKIYCRIYCLILLILKLSGDMMADCIYVKILTNFLWILVIMHAFWIFQIAKRLFLWKFVDTAKLLLKTKKK
jgi:hypothetical protein